MPVYGGSESSVYDYLNSRSTIAAVNMVIPDYQRTFSWTPENADQLVNDIETGIMNLQVQIQAPERLDSQSKFLGCIIQWNRNAEANKDFIPVPSIPQIARVNEIIDGQQRISTILLLLVELYWHFDKLKKNLDESETTEKKFIDFIETEVQNNWLFDSIARGGATGALPKYRPPIIRQGLDYWTHNTSPQYFSSVVSFLNNAIQSFNNGGEPIVSSSKEVNDVLERLQEKINIRLSRLSSVDIFSHYTEEELLRNLTTGRNAISIQQYIIDNPSRKDAIIPVLHQIAFVHYLLNYCKFTVLTAPNEATALDMFQSLNATGLQLTAVQILKPRVSSIYSKHNIQFAGQNSFHLFSSLEEWLTADNKDKRTKEFFLKFPMLLEGKEGLTSLSHQRNWLIGAYSNYLRLNLYANEVDATENFIKIMQRFSKYLDSFVVISFNKLASKQSTPGGGTSFPLLNLKHESALIHGRSLGGPAAISLLFLVKSGHDLAHTPSVSE